MIRMTPARTLRVLALAVVLLLSAGSAAAQSCFPVGVLLELRDRSGARIDPLALDSVVTEDAGAPYLPRHEVVRAAFEPASQPDSLNLLSWTLSGCRLRLRTVRLYRGGEEMRLRFDVWIDSEERGRASVFIVEAPPFRSGAFRLRFDEGTPSGEVNRLRISRDHWMPAER